MRVAFQVHGRVQGVGYRYDAATQGRRLQLAGWVRNEYDGTVSGEAEGDADAMEAFRDALRRGPHTAYVTRVDWVETSSERGLPMPFAVW